MQTEDIADEHEGSFVSGLRYTAPSIPAHEFGVSGKRIQDKAEDLIRSTKFIFKQGKEDDSIAVYEAVFNNLEPQYIKELVEEINTKQNFGRIDKLYIPRVHNTKGGLNSFRYDVLKT